MYIQTSNQEKMDLGFGNISCNWGVHIAGLYESKEERDEIIFGFLKEGLKNNDLQLYVPCERTQDNFQDEFGSHCPDCHEKMSDHDHLQLFDAKGLYYPDGNFSPQAMDSGLNAFFKNSQENGPRNIRATAEMVWALDDVPGKENLFAYESRLNYFIPNKPWISICMYNVTKFSGSTIMDVLRTHPYTINKGVFTENPYYEKPEIWLEKNAPQFLNKDLPDG